MTPIPHIKSPWRTLSLLLGFAFLYAPIVILIVYSFNESRLVTVWSGFSVKWYYELFQDKLMMDGVVLSLSIGVMTATMAVIVGTLYGSLSGYLGGKVDSVMMRLLEI